MIPKKEYKEEQGIAYITMDQFKEYHSAEDVMVFCEWFSGQTGIIAENGDHGIYVDDYERWLRQGKKSRQGADWD